MENIYLYDGEGQHRVLLVRLVQLNHAQASQLVLLFVCCKRKCARLL